MNVSLPLSSAGAIFFTLFLVILLAPLISERLRIPGIVGLVIGGLLVGPSGFNLLVREGLIAQLGGAGILYLMFLAGLELDVEGLGKRRRNTAILSALTFALPLSAGIFMGLVTDYPGLAAVLLGSLWASHTLLTYPLVRKYGLQRNRAVAVTVGATVITDTLALLVLAVVAHLHTSGSFSLAVGLELAGSVVALGVGTLFVIPRVIRWLLGGIGQDRLVRMLIVLIGAFGGAFLAEALGIEGIIGAFLMGLSLNPLVPRGGVLLERLELLGTGLLIPVFLISVGMLVDVGVIFEARTLLLGALFTVAAVFGKGAAALIAGRAAGFDRHEIGVMFSLSATQAAATLAATIVGFNIGLFDETTVHAILIVILATVILAAWAGQRAMPHLAGAPAVSDLGERVLVPVANPARGATHVEFAARLAAPDRGIVMPLHVVVDPERSGDSLQRARSWLDELERHGYRNGVEAHSQLRLDASVARGVGRAIRESEASVVVVGWSAAKAPVPYVTGGIVDDIIAGSSVPVLVVLERGIVPQRVILALSDHDLTAGAAHDVELAAGVAAKLGRGVGPRLLIAPDDSADMDGIVGRLGRCELVFDPSPRIEVLEAVAQPGDLVVVPGGEVGAGFFVREFAGMATAIPEATLVVAFGAHAAPLVEPAGLGIVRIDSTGRIVLMPRIDTRSNVNEYPVE